MKNTGTVEAGRSEAGSVTHVRHAAEPPPIPPEIDHHTMKLIVGLIAITLPFLVRYFAGYPLTAISASYWAGGWSQGIFVGFHFAIASFLLAYNGESPKLIPNKLLRQSAQMKLSRLAAVAAVCIALFPCGCDGHEEIIKKVHACSAAFMFIILVYFCWVFFHRAKGKTNLQAKLRAGTYVVCGSVISLMILAIAVYKLSGEPVHTKYPRLVFWAEGAALVAFGWAWLTASRYLPVVTGKHERFSLFRKRIATQPFEP